MKNTIFVILSILFMAIFFNTCTRHFSPLYYYQEMSRSDNDISGDTDEPEVGGEGILSDAEDPFKTGEWNREDYRGFTLDLDNEYVIAASFGLKNEPTYMLIKDDTWKPLDLSRNEYYYDGTNTKAAGFTVTKVKYYMYKNMNPTFSSTSAYNKSDRLERFWFYRFTGTAGLSTDNYLIAIDSYSKLVFAFAIPTKWKSILGIPAPIEWGAVELGWEASADSATLNEQVKFAVEGLTYFYEYDPVGIVHSDGTIEIYDWCTLSIANDNSYAPRLDGSPTDLKRNVASNGSPGRSPYLPIKIVEKNKIALQVQDLQIQNISAQSFVDKLSGKDEYTNYAGFSYDIRLGYNLNSDTINYNIIASKEKPSLFFDSLAAVNVGETKSILSTVYTLDVQYEDTDEVYFYLDASIKMYDRTYKIPQIANDTVLIEQNKPLIKFRYDKNQDMFVFDSSSGDVSDVSFDKTFTLKKGEIKQFEITINNSSIGADDAEGSIKLIYSLTY
ncbi:hypothetical protein Q5M87_01015 [Brachyspira innocens]|uniref:Lipoprotein n=1 Tax=Brachyspira innocens TaxID=13264 RepID=A0ABT8YVF6_9SPIR|nr:hypothetical protein [Brachyspira innocens]MDO6992582.1 hypothetical protein [Brachyspira innocens]MDO7019889.1 hypothetical protein [Brachyspira innocens]